MTTVQLGFDAIERAAILDQVLEHASDAWQVKAFRTIAILAATKEPFQATALVARGVPEPDHPSRWGGVFSAASHAGLIRRVGYAPSLRATVRGSAAAVWQGAEFTNPPRADNGRFTKKRRRS